MNLGGIAFLIPTQIGMKMFTFLMNTFFILRYTLPEVKGMVFKLEFTSQIVLYFCRESFRKACKRVQNETSVFSLALLQVLLGGVAILGIGFLYRLEYLSLFLVASMMEVITEPFYILYIGDYKFKVMVEFLSIFSKYMYLVFVSKNVLNFGIAQMIASFIMLILYLFKAMDKFTFQWSSIEKGSIMNVFTFLYQTILKFLLTEGENFLLFSFFASAEQGVYDVSFHLGSLVPRMIFQPIEEVSNTGWSKMLNQKKVEKAEYSMALNVFELFFKYLLIFSLYFISFGFHLTSDVIRLIYGARWAETDLDMLLSCFCIYILFLAINGITECFVQAVASPEDVGRHNWFMIGTSVFYFLISWGLLIRWKFTWILILTNCLNLGLRILYSMWYIQAYFAKQELKLTFSFSYLYVVFAICFFVTWRMKFSFVTLGMIVVTMYLVYREQDFKQFIAVIRGRQKME